MSQEKKLTAIKGEHDKALINVLQSGKPGEYVITTTIHCGHGGGISKASVKAAHESPVRWEK